MEAFEHLVKVALEHERYVVSSNMKFPVRKRTKKRQREEYQEHGYEVDLVGARRDSLILASVKSFFGSSGVSRQGFEGVADSNKKTHFKLYALFNDETVRQGVVKAASERFGYSPSLISLWLCVGKFRSGHQEAITKHLEHGIRPFCNEVIVMGLHDIMRGITERSRSRTYLNDPVVMTIKALEEMKLIKQF